MLSGTRELFSQVSKLGNVRKKLCASYYSTIDANPYKMLIVSNSILQKQIILYANIKIQLIYAIRRITDCSHFLLKIKIHDDDDPTKKQYFQFVNII